MDRFAITFVCPLNNQNYDFRRLFTGYLNTFKKDDYVSIDDLHRFLATHYYDVSCLPTRMNKTFKWLASDLHNYSSNTDTNILDNSITFKLYLPPPVEEDDKRVEVVSTDRNTALLLEILKEVKQIGADLRNGPKIQEHHVKQVYGGD